MIYIISLIAGLEFTVIIWLLVGMSVKPKPKKQKRNYSAHVDYLLDYEQWGR